MRNIAIFTGVDIRTFGGGERYAIELANRLKNSNVTIFSNIEKNNRLTSEDIRGMLHDNVKLKFYKTIKLPVFKILPLNYSFLKSISEIKNFDVVYNMDQYFPITNLGILIVCKLFRKKYVLGIHNPDFFADRANNPSLIKNIIFPIYSFFRSMIVSAIANIHVINNDDVLKLKEWHYEGKVYYIPHFSYKISKKTENNSKKFIALFVGRLHIRHKGLDLLSKIIEDVLNKNKKIIFHIVGCGEDGEHLIRTLAQKYPKNVKWFGFLSDKKLDYEYKKSSIFVFPSRIESFGLTLLEAQSNGLPAIAFNVKGPSSIMAKQYQGRIIESFNTDQFSNMILKYYKLWKNKGYYTLKKKIARNIKENYGYEALEPKINELFSTY